jgi:SAM-dependent methyltransferase
VPQDSYATDARFYDAIHAQQRDDIGLWLSFAGRSDRPVLEVGTGTGRVATELARAGHTVTGIDTSSAMLRRAHQRSDEYGLDIEFIVGGLPELALEADHYGLVLLPADVMLYCGDGQEQLAWLEAAARVVHFSGVVAVDLPGPAAWLDPSTNGQPLLVFAGTDSEGRKFEAWHVHEDDLASQTRWLRAMYDERGEDGTLRRFESDHELRYIYRFELEYLLQTAGLSRFDIYGDYDLGALTNDSERMIAIARRAGG